MIPFVQAEFYTATSGRQIDLVVIHDMEYPERITAAEDCAAYFAHPRQANGSPNRASAHYCIDADSIVQCVRDQDVAYAAPRVNHNGVHLEHAGYAAQSRQEWLDGYSLAMLKLSAQLTADLCRRYNIPTVHVDRTGLTSGARGITTHRESTEAFGIVGGHTDPGPAFPMDVYIGFVQAAAKPLPPPGDEMSPEQEAKMDALAVAVAKVADDLTALRRQVSMGSKKPDRTMQTVLGLVADKLGVGN